MPQAEFAYNDSPNRSTGKIPFQIVYGMHPRGISELRIWDKMSSEVQEKKDFAAEMHKLHDQIKGQLQDNSQKYKKSRPEKKRGSF
jgi:hypothetical protein